MNLVGMRLLVTGGAGFIGSQICEAALKYGAEVTCLDDLSAPSTILFQQLKSHPNFIFVLGDIRNKEICFEVMENCSHVCHQAAIVSVAASMDNPKAVNEINVTGTYNLIKASMNYNIKRFVFASSCAVYGSRQPPQHETMELNPLSPYAESKVEGERMLSSFGIEAVALRYFNVYGPHQSNQGDFAAVVPRMTSDIMRGEAPLILGKGEQTRDFVFVDDVVSANLLALTCDLDTSFTVVNIGSGKETSINQLKESIYEVVSSIQLEDIKVDCKYQPSREQEVERSRANLEFAKKSIGFNPQTPLFEGLAHYVTSLAGDK